MKKSVLFNLEKGAKIQHKRNGQILTVVAVQEDKIVCEEKTISISNCTRWFDVVEEQQVEDDNTATKEDNTVEEKDDTQEQQDTANTNTGKTNTGEGTIQQNNLIQSLNSLMDLHNVVMECKKEYIKVSMEGKRGALCMIRQTRFGTGIHIDFKSKILAKLDENYRGMLIEQYNCHIYDRTRGYYRVFDCSDLDVLETIILTAKQVA